VEGVIDRVTYRDEKSMYTVARIKAGDGSIVTAVGPFPSATAGQTVKVFGAWVQHREYGRQLKVERVETVAPATLLGIEKYLGSGLIRGIGPATAGKLVKRFGMDTLTVIESNPERLTEVPGIGPKKAQRIIDAIAEHKSVQKVMVFLQSHGVSPAYAVKIYRRYGEDAVAIVSGNPYRLADDVYGIGFKTADKIAAEVGVDAESPHRIAAGIKYWLGKASEEGHCYSEADEVSSRVAH